MTDSSSAGVLPVDKPEGPTSHDVVAAARRFLHARRIGHTGTLDPFASGLLLLCVGTATRIAEYLTGLPKTYVATLRFGAATDTDDPTGRTLAVSDHWRDLDRARIEEALQALRGEQAQLPPLYSAKKVGGRAMHRLARAGVAPPREPVTVRIHDVHLLDVFLPDATFTLVCSAGTYVRAVARDLGEALGVYGHLRSLRRTRIGDHDVTSAIGLEELQDPATVRRAWIDPLRALAHMPRISIGADEAAAVAHGRAIAHDRPVPAGRVAIEHAGRLVAIADSADGRLSPVKVFTA